MVGARDGGGQARAVREAARADVGRGRHARRGARPHRPPHRGGVLVPQPSAMGDDPRAARRRRDRRAPVGARHARQAVPRPGRHPQPAGQGRRRALRPRLLRDQRVHARLRPRPRSGDRRARHRPAFPDRPPVDGDPRLRRPARHDQRVEPGRPERVGVAPAVHGAGQPRLARMRLPLRARPSDGLPGVRRRRTERRFEPVNQYALQFERFSRHLLGERVPSWPIEDAATTLSIIEALFASARDGQWRKP